MDFLFHAHSGLRYIVLLVGLVAIAVLAVGLIRKKSLSAERGLMAAFVGVLDLQVVLGIVLLFVWPFYGALMGHIMMMVLAAVAAHLLSVRAKKAADPNRATLLRLWGVVVPFILIVLGILAIGRSVV